MKKTYKLELQDFGKRGRLVAAVMEMPDKNFIDRDVFTPPTWELEPGYYVIQKPLSATEYTKYGLHVCEQGRPTILTETESFNKAISAERKRRRLEEPQRR